MYRLVIKITMYGHSLKKFKPYKAKLDPLLLFCCFWGGGGGLFFGGFFSVDFQLDCWKVTVPVLRISFSYTMTLFFLRAGNLSPLPPRQEQALAPAPLMTHHAHTTAHLLTTQQLPSYRHLSPAPPPAPHTHPHQPHNPISNPNPPLSRRNSVKSHISFASPPTSMIDEPLTINLQRCI